MRLRMPFGRKPKEFPDHLWTKCPTCGEMLFNKQLVRNLNVCSKCEHHFRLGARPRIEQLVDKGSFVEQDSDLVSGDPLRFVDSKPYPDRIAAAQAKSGEKDAAIAGTAAIGGNPVELVVMDFEFMGGSMGSVVGEKITRAAERALAQRRALVIVSASGGARSSRSASRSSWGRSAPRRKTCAGGCSDDRRESPLVIDRIVGARRGIEGNGHLADDANLIIDSGQLRTRASAWDAVQAARNIKRPHTLDVITRVFDRFQELHGDRGFRDDPAIVGGIAELQ